MDAEPNVTRAMRMIREKGIVRGRDMHHKLGIPYDDLVKTAEELVKRDLVDVKGECSDSRKIAYTVFSYRPSAEPKVRQFLEE